jgi:hypothetical protein
MFIGPGGSQAGNPLCSLDEHDFLAAASTCARCHSPIDRATQCLDGEYDLVCRDCYALTASDWSAVHPAGMTRSSHSDKHRGV